VKKEFAINLVFLVLVNLMIKPIYILGIDVGVQNAVGPESYGLYFYLLGYVYLFQVINDLGIQNFNNRFISLNETLLSKYFPHILSLKLALGLLFCAVVLIAGSAMGLVALHPLLFVLIAFNLFLDSLNGYLRSNVAGLGWYRHDSILSVTDKIIMILIVGFLLLHPTFSEDFQIIWFALAQTVSFLMVTIICLIMLSPRLRSLWKKPDLKYFLLVFRKSWPFALILLSTFFYNRLDGVMIGLMMEDGETQAGYYAAAFRLYDAATMFTFLFVGLLYPMFSKMLSREHDPTGLYHFGMGLVWITSLAILAFMLFFSVDIMELLYEEPGPFAGLVLSLLAMAFVAKSIFHISGSYLLSHGDLKYINVIFGSGVAINFLLNLLLIPRYGIVGACMATLITQAGIAFALALRCIKFVSTGVNYKKLLISILFLTVIVLSWIYLYRAEEPADLVLRALLTILIWCALLVPSLIEAFQKRDSIRKWLKT